MTDSRGHPDIPGGSDVLRPAPTGLSACVWEAAVIAHERESFSNTLLRGEGSVADRAARWEADLLDAGTLS